MARQTHAWAAAVALVGLLLASDVVVGKDTLFPGESLQSGEFLENGPYRFIMQDDCNLVLYVSQSRSLWASGTDGKGTACVATLQADGYLVVLSGSIVLWSSNTAGGFKNYILIVQRDGNVVIYGAALWATNTAQSRRRLL
uniref:Mannose-specific lectin n=1 Tax=Anthurium amnicola TaxID=1678845 RepID=A0A1D1YFN4_9ARAE